MLVPVLAIIMTPMQTRMIHTITVPALKDIDLSIVWPGEGLRRE